MKRFMKAVFVVCLFLLHAGYTNAVSISGDYSYDSIEADGTLTFSNVSMAFDAQSFFELEMTIIFRNYKTLILINKADDEDQPLFLTRSYGTDDIEGVWKLDFNGTEVDFNLVDDGTFSLVYSDDSSGGTDPTDPEGEEEDDSPDSLCFIGTLY